MVKKHSLTLQSLEESHFVHLPSVLQHVLPPCHLNLPFATDSAALLVALHICREREGYEGWEKGREGRKEGRKREEKERKEGREEGGREGKKGGGGG